LACVINGAALFGTTIGVLAKKDSLLFFRGEV